MNKWIKRFLIYGFVAFLLMVIGLVIEWQITLYSGKTRLAKARAVLDAAEPGWQLDELNGRRSASLPPDDQNIAVIALNVVNKVPKEFNDWEKKLEKDPRTDLKPNHLVDPQVFVSVRKQFEPIKPLVVQLHEIRKYPTGGFKIVFPEPNVLGALLTDSQKLREAAGKLSWQVILSTQDNDPNTAIEACRTGAHLRHAIGDEPTLISQLIRMALIAISINSTERTLGMTEPKTGLAELQADFEKALLEKDFIAGIEGERAVEDRLCENIANGSMSAAVLTGAPPGTPAPPSPSILESAGQMFLSRYIRDNHAQIIELNTSFRDAAKLHGKERSDAVKKIWMPKTRSISNVYVYLLLPAFEKLMEADTRTEAKLSTMIAAIACERYRQVNGKWPANLSDIPKDILKDIPLDPYVGGPVKYKKNATGIVIYTTGKDEVDNGGVTLDVMGTKPNADIGVQLFDPTYRRMPAEVKPKEFDDGPPPLPEPEKP